MSGAAGVGTAPAPARTSVEINPGCVPDPARPHTQLVLIGDAPGTAGTRVMVGCLRPTFRGYVNSAAAFAAAKVTVAAPPGTPPWTLTAARAEVLLPPGADDRFAEPRVLMEEVDAALPRDGKALLSYLTFTFACERLHHQWELVRAFAQRFLVQSPFELAVLLVQHAPGRAGFASRPHVHAMLAGPRRLTSLGFGEWYPELMNDKAHALIRDGFLEFQAASPRHR